MMKNALTQNGSIAPWAVLVLMLGAQLSFAAPSYGEERLCSNTTSTVHESCKAEVESSYWLAIGTCFNQTAMGAQQACEQQAWAELVEAWEECFAQQDARREVCAVLGETAYDPQIDPADFVTSIDHPYLPMRPGTTMIYAGEEERIEVTVTEETKEILGVTCTVVRDTVYEEDEIIEDTYDWFAQDREGNVWYFGELSQEFEEGELIGLEGSWKAGIDGAKPGIIMPAIPAAGSVYRQEYLLAEAEDMARILGADEQLPDFEGTLNGTPVTISFDNVLVTEEWTPIEPGGLEHKYYAPGVGLVLEVDPETGEEVKLVEVNTRD